MLHFAPYAIALTAKLIAVLNVSLAVLLDRLNHTKCGYDFADTKCVTFGATIRAQSAQPSKRLCETLNLFTTTI